MSHDPAEQRDGEPFDAATLLARGRMADAAARALREASVRDLLLPDAARLDDRRRAALRTLLRAIVGTIGGDIHDAAERRLTERGAAAAARALRSVEARQVMPLVERQFGGDLEVAGDLIDRVTLDLIGEALPDGLVEDDAVRWTPAAAVAEPLRLAENRRRAAPDQPPYATDLSAESCERFTWWVAAAIAHVANDAGPALSDAVARAASQGLAHHDEGERLEAVAIRAALRLDRKGADLAPAIDHCLRERRIVLLVALLAHAGGIPFDAMRAMVVNPDDARLWLALRAVDLPAPQLARLGYALCEADRRRDTDRFAEQFDAILAVDPEAARAAIAPLRLPTRFRQALEALR